MQEIGFIKFSFNISEGLFCLFSQSTEGLILIVTLSSFQGNNCSSQRLDSCRTGWWATFFISRDHAPDPILSGFTLRGTMKM